MTSSVAELPTVTGTCPEPLTAAVRRAVRSGGSWQQTADRVVAALRGRLPGPGLLSAASSSPATRAATRRTWCTPSPTARSRSWSWSGCPARRRPCTTTCTWCCTAVLQGTEYEEVYAVRGDHLEVVARNANPVGTVSGFAPPGDVHLVRTSATRSRSPCTSTAPTSPASAQASAASTTSRSASPAATAHLRPAQREPLTRTVSGSLFRPRLALPIHSDISLRCQRRYKDH